MGFVRRFTSMPASQVLAEIEGLVIVDATPPSAVAGVSTGVVAVVGEFADMAYGVAVSSAGVVSSDPRPVEIYSGQDLVEKLGGWDSTLGEWGITCGSGWAALQGHAFSRLVAVPVNLCSSRGVRLFRDLPTNTSAADPSPVVQMQAATVEAGRQFRTGTSRAATGTRKSFLATDAYHSGTDGATTAVTDSATGATVTSGAGPFDFRAAGANQISMQFNAGGVQNFNITANHSIRKNTGGIAAYPWTGSFDVAFESGPVQTVTGAGVADVAALIALINTSIFGGRGVLNGADCDLTSDVGGTSSLVTISNVVNTIGNCGFTAGTGTLAPGSDVANDAQVTAAELALIIDGPLTNGTCTAVGATLRFTSSTTGVAGTATVLVASTMDVRMGGEFATNVVKNGTDAGPGTQTANTLTSATGDFVNEGVAKGDIVVLGVIGGAGALGTNAMTLRVRAVSSATQLSLEKMDGSAFSFATDAGALPWRIHVSGCADTGGANAVDETGGYVVPARALDATIAGDTTVSPISVPPAATATTWDPLSGLKLRTMTGATGLVYTAAVQAPNAPQSASLDALYETAIRGLMSDELPSREVNVVFSARCTNDIASKLYQLMLDTDAVGMPKVAVVSPPVNQVTVSTVLGDAAPGVGVNRLDRVLYCWPAVQTKIGDLVGERLRGADGFYYDEGVVDMPASGWMASILSLLQPERNPGQTSDPVPRCLSTVYGLGRGTPALQMSHYKLFRAKGVCALRDDPDQGWQFQSGITTNIAESTRKTIARRRMADYIQQSLAAALAPLVKEPMTEGLKKAAHAVCYNWLKELKSEERPEAQRIDDFSVDAESGNTDALEAQGIFVLNIAVRTLASADVIVLNTQISEQTVVVSAAG